MIPSFQCPSDIPQGLAFSAMSAAAGGQIPAFPWSATKGNYGANWGNTDYAQGVPGLDPGWFTPALHLASPFGINSNGSGPSLVRIASVTDGTSNTQFVSEVLQGAPDDIRGAIWVDNPGAGTYMTRFTPNGFRDYVPLFQPWASAVPASGLAFNNADNLPSFAGSGIGTSPPAPGSLCDSQGPQGLLCNYQGSQGGEFSGSRSRHPGGVNCAFGDGSVHFMKNTISPLTWVQLGSMSGGEVISSDRIESPVPGEPRPPGRPARQEPRPPRDPLPEQTVGAARRREREGPRRRAGAAADPSGEAGPPHLDRSSNFRGSAPPGLISASRSLFELYLAGINSGPIFLRPSAPFLSLASFISARLILTR